MIKEFKINLFDMVLGLSDVIDLIRPVVYDHHKRVALIATNIANEMGLSTEEQRNILMAGALHDVGAVLLKHKEDTLDFESDAVHKHCEMGYFFLRQFEPFEEVATLIRYHHNYWDNGKSSEIPMGAHILHLADSIEVLIDRKNSMILRQVDGICNVIREQEGDVFHPEIVDAFLSLAKKECFWLDISSPTFKTIHELRSRFPIIELDFKRLLDLSKLFSRVIDFRSRFTSIHSSGVAAISEAIAKELGWPEHEAQMIRIAGFLHDLGKLAVPIEVLEKPDKLTLDEVKIIKSHTYYTYRVLENIKGLETINEWASHHHEYLNGTGYPFHYSEKELSVGSRIVAVADVFTAITEDRPYRSGMNSEKALQILGQMADNNVLDENIVNLVKKNCFQLNKMRIEAQDIASQEYEEFLRMMKG